jgi:hypothetical protein
MMSLGVKRRGASAVIAALVCVLAAILVVGVAPAAAEEEGDSAPLRPVSEGGLTFGEIRSPSDPEKYPLQFELGKEQIMRQVDEHEVVVEYPGHVVAYTIEAPLAHDAVGANVPTTFELGENDVLTFFVHHREGNPLASGAPFVYPIISGAGWEGGYHVISVELNDSHPPSPTTVSAPVAPTPCSVPSLHGLSLKAAKARLRAAHCSIGEVHLVAGAGAANGKVVKQFRAAGTELAAGASVAVKLGSR